MRRLGIALLLCVACVVVVAQAAEVRFRSIESDELFNLQFADFASGCFLSESVDAN